MENYTKRSESERIIRSACMLCYAEIFTKVKNVEMFIEGKKVRVIPIESSNINIIRDVSSGNIVDIIILYDTKENAPLFDSMIFEYKDEDDKIIAKIMVNDRAWKIDGLKKRLSLIETEKSEMEMIIAVDIKMTKYMSLWDSIPMAVARRAIDLMCLGEVRGEG